MAKFCLKKSIVALACCFAAHGAHADFVGVYVGGGAWQTGLTGNVGATAGDASGTATMEELGLEENQNAFVWAALEHPIPVIPNIKIAMSALTVNGDGSVSGEVSFGGDDSVPADANTSSEIDLGYTEATLYYEILDNWLNLDIGLTARAYDGGAVIDWETPEDADTASSGSIEESLSETLPMLYAKAQFDLPFSGFYAGGHINFIGYDNNSISDIEAKIGYMTDGLVLDFGVEVGYRQMKLTLEAEDNLEADITADGLFLGLIAHF